MSHPNPLSPPSPLSPLKVMTVVGTRPEIIRLARVMARLDSSPAIHHILVHTGQNYDYELNQIFFDELGLRTPDHFLDCVGETVADTLGQVIARAYAVMVAESPDAVLILGDTNSCLSAIAAKRLKIPVFHMEAGNRCHDQRVPEEINRRIVDHVSDINLPYSTLARENLLREGLPGDRCIKTGSPMKEVLDHYAPLIKASTVLPRLGLTAGDYYVVSCHREENVDDPANLARFASLLDALSARPGREGGNSRVIVSTHPRTRKRLEAGGYRFGAEVALMKPLGLPDFVHLQQHARCVLSDSGTITEEASLLGFPALNLRETHERPEGMEEAAVMLTGLSLTNVERGLAVLEAEESPTHPRRVADYEVPNVSEKVLRILLSYTDYVRRNVWKQATP